jgi:hypothetical protein
MSTYRTAIDLTITAIDQRSRIFRNQVVAIVIVIFFPIVAAIALRTLWPLTFLLALAPVCGLFVWFDIRQVARWHSTILEMWARRDIGLLAFTHAMRANKMLPEATLNSMLGLLGTPEIAKLEINASARTRKTVASVVKFADTLGLRQIVVKACAAAIVSASICWAAAAGTWLPPSFTASILPMPLILRWLQASLHHQAKLAVQAASQDPDFNADTFHDLINHLSPKEAQALAHPWTNTGQLDRQVARPCD